jgi:RNA recognition motif. (a.k.a. RRM, RBD, or RNP domain)
MSRAYSAGKRDREQAQARKKKERDLRRSRKRRTGRGEVPVVEAEAVTGNLDVVEAAVKRRQAAATKGAAGIPSRLFVGGLAWETTADDLREAFGAFGQVSDAVVVMDRGTGRSRGFGFVVMNHKDAPKAIVALNGTELQGRPIIVNVASERPGR